MTRAGMASGMAATALVLVLAARLISMSLLPLTDPTEGRYAQVSQEMVATGDWVTPRIWMNETHLPFLGKPPLYFWQAAGAMRLFGQTEFAARLPGVVSAAVLLVLLYAVMRRYGTPGSGLLSVMLTASCGFFIAVGGSVAVDMLFSTCVAGCLLAYFAFLNEPERRIRRRWSLLVFVLLAFGFLTKGPVTLVLFGLPVLIWTIRWHGWRLLRDHQWAAGPALFLALVMPWFVICEIRNPGFLKYFFVNENLLRFLTHDYGDAYGSGHLYPRGAAFLMLLAATAPWSLLGLWRAVRGRSWRHLFDRGDRNIEFLFLGFAAGTVFWCLARQLLFTYLLPMVPLFAAWLAQMTCTEAVRKRLLAGATALTLSLAVVSVACVPFMRYTESTRAIVAAARLHADGSGQPLVFARKTPYSALFYARGWVVPHPREDLSASLTRCEGKSRTALVVIESRRANDLKTLAPGSWTELTNAGGWILGRVTLPVAGS